MSAVVRYAQAMAVGSAILVVGILIGWFGSRHYNSPYTATPSGSSEVMPGAALIENFTCPRGQQRIVVMHGMEDNFALGEPETSEIRPELLEVEFYKEMFEGRNAIFGHRDYDEGGADKFLIDNFDLPSGILSGVFVTRIMTTGDSRSDSLTFGAIDSELSGPPASRVSSFGVPIADTDTGGLLTADNGMLVVRLDELSSTNGNARSKNFLDYLNSASRNDRVDMVLQDDTRADFAAFLLCQQPTEKRGTTFVEYSVKTSVPGLSWFTCANDKTLPSCNPFAGDHKCDIPAPIACYKEGSRPEPDNLSATVTEGYFSGGEIKLSKEVRPDRFEKVEDANQFCAAEFGQGWRVLTYHEASGGAVASYSDIPPRSRGIVHVGDREYGNCWDRPKSVMRP